VQGNMVCGLTGGPLGPLGLRQPDYARFSR
jgi:hypothetical protein